jgi:hypothetical protein
MPGVASLVWASPGAASNGAAGRGKDEGASFGVPSFSLSEENSDAVARVPDDHDSRG